MLILASAFGEIKAVNSQIIFPRVTFICFNSFLVSLDSFVVHCQFLLDTLHIPFQLSQL